MESSRAAEIWTLSNGGHSQLPNGPVLYSRRAAKRAAVRRCHLREVTFQARVDPTAGGGAVIVLPFDADLEWGEKGVHHVNGCIAGCAVRGPLRRDGDRWLLALGPAWLRDCPVSPGAEVQVNLRPEGPQRADLAPDFAEALAAEPEAGEFFDSLATFYRKGYLRWIDATKRRPDVRRERIAEVVALLKARQKAKP